MSTIPGPEAGRDRGLARRDPSGSLDGASAHRSAGPALVVMTRNVYVGAEIEAVLGASDPAHVPLRVAEAFAAVRATDFAERADGPRARGAQRAQAAELLEALEEVDHPVVLVGDLNSAADGSSTGTYRMMLDAGFVDAWTLGGTGAGFTSSQAADLRNPESRLFHRIDFVLYRDADTRAGGDFPGTVRAELVGEDPADRTPSGLWPSDHAGVVAFLSFDGE